VTGTSVIHDTLAILCFRSLPIVGFCLTTRTISFGRKGIILLTYAIPTLTIRILDLPTIAWLAVVYGYFAAIGGVAPIAARLLRERRMTRGGLFAACISAFLAVPCFLVPGPARAAALLLGWDIMLSSYSYCVEVAKGRDDPTRADCLFFLLVNPALVYVNRGKQVSSPALSTRGLGRSALGLLTLLVTFAVVTPACAAVKGEALAFPSPHERVGALAAFGVLRFFVEYGRQAGLASLQIGLMRLLGHEIPERFRWPIAARNPLDFWRRWNTYVSGWALRYVFWPVAHRYRGHQRSWRFYAAQALAIIATFIVVGLLHDMYMYAAAFDDELRSLRAFSLIAVIVVLWLVGTWLWRRFATSRALSRGPAWVFAFASRASLWTLAIACVAWGWR
jgi:hypothetical protein